MLCWVDLGTVFFDLGTVFFLERFGVVEGVGGLSIYIPAVLLSRGLGKLLLGSSFALVMIRSRHISPEPIRYRVCAERGCTLILPD